MVKSEEGLVIRSTAGFVDALVGDGVVRCTIRGRLKQLPRGTDLCVIGDQVTIERNDSGTGVVIAVLPRHSRFSRRQPGRGPNKEDVVVANLDRLLVTFSYGQPVFNARLLDRFLVIAEHQGVEPIVVMNKSDLQQPSETDWRRRYEAIGYRWIDVSATYGSGLDELSEVLEGSISAFVGPSGVGKSSLINRLLPELELDVASVSDHHGKGRHTTRVASLYQVHGGGFLADTPGIRELGTWALPLNELDGCFPELAEHRSACSFRSCSHTHEPACGVIEALEQGWISKERYESYVRLRNGEPA